MRASLTISFPRSIAEGTLEAAIAATRPRIAGCWLTGLYRARAAERALEAAGFERGWQPHWMAGATAPARTDARVEHTASVPEYDALGQALLTMPRSFHYVARVDGRLAGRAWLHLAGRTAGIYDVEVWLGGRTGIGTALTRAAMADAPRLGSPEVVLNATPEGTALYEALGFRSLGWGMTWWRHAAST